MPLLARGRFRTAHASGSVEPADVEADLVRALELAPEAAECWRALAEWRRSWGDASFWRAGRGRGPCSRCAYH